MGVDYLCLFPRPPPAPDPAGLPSAEAPGPGAPGHLRLFCLSGLGPQSLVGKSVLLTQGVSAVLSALHTRVHFILTMHCQVGVAWPASWRGSETLHTFKRLPSCRRRGQSVQPGSLHGGPRCSAADPGGVGTELIRTAERWGEVTSQHLLSVFCL